FGISIDGHGAGPDQDLANPMGIGGMALHQWVFGTKTFQKMAGDFAGSLIGDKVAREGVDDNFAARGFENLGAWIMGRTMSVRPSRWTAEPRSTSSPMASTPRSAARKKPRTAKTSDSAAASQRFAS